MEKPIMLIVDDTEISRLLLFEYFQKDYTILLASNGQEAIEKIESAGPLLSIILLDIVMPVMDGMAVLRWMADKPCRSVPVIAITAEPRYQLEALRSGASDFISKPIENEILQIRIDHVLNRGSLEDERRRNARLFKEQQERDLLINSIPGGIGTYRILPDHIEISYFSDGIAHLCGYTREEYSQKFTQNAAAVIYREDRPRVQFALQQALQNDQTIDETYRCYHKDGSLIWVRLTGMRIGTEDGVPVIHAVFQRPPRMAQLYDNLVNESKNLIYVSDITNYDLLYVNATGLRAIKKKDTDYSRTKCYEFLFGRSSPCPFCKIAQMNPETYLERDFLYPINGKNYAMRGKLTNWNGIPAHVEYAQDVTDQKKIARENSDLLHQLQSMMENIPGGMCVYRAEGNHISPLVHNQAFFDIFGYSSEHRLAVTNSTDFLNVHPDDLQGLQQAIEKTLRTNTRLDTTYRSFHDLKGCYIWINMKAVVVAQSSGEKLCYVSYNDVTSERHAQEQLVKAQRELQENQLRYETAIKSSGINIWEYNIPQDSLYVISNSSRIRQNCYHIDHYVSSTLNHGYVREDSIPKFKKIFERLRQGEPTVMEDLWYKTTDEAGWWCERVTYSSVYDANGKPLKAYGAGRDVTAEKIAEQKFHEELTYRKAMQHENNASVMVDLTENLVVEVDSPFRVLREQLGNTADQYFAKTEAMLTGEENKHLYHQLFSRSILLNNFNNGEFSKSVETTRLYDSNKVFWIKYNVHLIQNPETKHIVAHVTCIDITQEKVMQTIMETVSATDYDRFIVVDGSSDSALDYGAESGTHLFQESLSYEQQNEAFLRGCVCEEDLERVLAECKVASAWEHIKNGDPYKFSFNMHTENGGIRHKQMQFTKISDPRKTYLISLMDVNNIYEEQEAAKQKLQQALLDAKQANQVKTDFLSRMSHDIRTPMNAVISLSALGRDSTDLAETKDYLQKIEFSGQYLLAIINDVLNLSKMENRGIVLQPRAVSFPSFIESTVSIVMPTAQEKNIQLEVSQININTPYLKLDTTYVRQVVVNLLSNAIKFTPNGGKIELIVENLSQEGNLVKNRLIVKDNGIGISPDFLPKIFVPFEQENTLNDLSRQGTGLGLSIVKEIIEQMNGKIWVESEKGHGSSFFVEWFFEIASSDELAVETHDQQDLDLESLRGKRILLAEDHPLNAAIAVKLLTNKGMIVEHAEDGQKAVSDFATSAAGYYDAVLMDIRMPVMNGLEAAKAIRQLGRPDAKTIPVIAMTANAFDDDVRSALAAGMNAHLAKPIDPQKLYQTLASWITQNCNASQKS